MNNDDVHGRVARRKPVLSKKDTKHGKLHYLLHVMFTTYSTQCGGGGELVNPGKSENLIFVAFI